MTEVTSGCSYPTDNDESRIYPGVLAAFTQSHEIGREEVTYVAVVDLPTDHEVRPSPPKGSL